MKKHFLNVFVALLFSSLFIFSSCNSSSPSSDGELGFTIPASLVKSIAKKSRAGGDLNGLPGFDIDMKFVVSLKGDGGTSKSETKTLFKALVSGDYNDEAGTIDFKFTDLIVSETYSINVKAYLTYDGGELLAYEGSAENIKITSGDNKVVKITLKGTDEYYDSLSTFIILYNKIGDPNNQRYGLYGFTPDFLRSGTQKEPVVKASEGSSFVEFVIGEDSTLYWTDGYDIYTNYDNEALASIDFDSYGVNPPANEDLRLFADSDGLIFCGGNGSENWPFEIGVYDINHEDRGFEVSGINKEELQPYIPDIEITKVFDFATDLEFVDSSEYDGYLYFAFRYTYFPEQGEPASDIAFARVPMAVIATNNGDGSSHYISITTSEIEIIKFLDKASVSPYAASLSTYAEITDMIIQNNCLYALLRERTDYIQPLVTGEETSRDYYSRGAVIRIKLNDFSANGLNIFGETAMISANEFEGSDSYKALVYQPERYLFGPEKFIGFDPRKLIIADNGVMLYKEGADTVYKNINKIVTVTLTDNFADSVATGFEVTADPEIFFSREDNEPIEFMDSTYNPFLSFTKVE